MKTANIEVEYLMSCGDDTSVVNAARVSFNKRTPTMTDKDARLINYLAKHKHHSPFNHAFLSFRVKAPIFVARQLVKHKFLPWNEVSRRYVDSPPEFYIPDEIRKKSDNVKQGSSDETLPEWLDGEDDQGFYQYSPVASIQGSSHYAVRAYQELLNHGACPEQARMVLPQNTMSEWVWSGTLGAWLDMLVLRLDSHTQKETREVAEKIAVFVKNIFPESYKAYLGDSDA